MPLLPTLGPFDREYPDLHQPDRVQNPRHFGINKMPRSKTWQKPYEADHTSDYNPIGADYGSSLEEDTEDLKSDWSSYSSGATSFRDDAYKNLYENDNSEYRRRRKTIEKTYFKDKPTGFPHMKNEKKREKLDEQMDKIIQPGEMHQHMPMLNRHLRRTMRDYIQRNLKIRDAKFRSEGMSTQIEVNEVDREMSTSSNKYSTEIEYDPKREKKRAGKGFEPNIRRSADDRFAQLNYHKDTKNHVRYQIDREKQNNRAILHKPTKTMTRKDFLTESSPQLEEQLKKSSQFTHFKAQHQKLLQSYLQVPERGASTKAWYMDINSGQNLVQGANGELLSDTFQVRGPRPSIVDLQKFKDNRIFTPKVMQSLEKAFQKSQPKPKKAKTKLIGPFKFIDQMNPKLLNQLNPKSDSMEQTTAKKKRSAKTNQPKGKTQQRPKDPSDDSNPDSGILVDEESSNNDEYDYQGDDEDNDEYDMSDDKPADLHEDSGEIGPVEAPPSQIKRSQVQPSKTPAKPSSFTRAQNQKSTQFAQPQHTPTQRQPASSPQGRSFLNSGAMSYFLSHLKHEQELERVLVNERLTKLGLKEIKVTGDGNCQFRALSYFLWGTESKHMEMRKQLVTWLYHNKELMADFAAATGAPSWEHYCASMFRNMVWGDHFTLVAAATLFKIRIVIVSSLRIEKGSPLNFITPQDGSDFTRTVHLLHYHENHFNALEPSGTKVNYEEFAHEEE